MKKIGGRKSRETVSLMFCITLLFLCEACMLHHMERCAAKDPKQTRDVLSAQLTYAKITADNGLYATKNIWNKHTHILAF
jgi:hypothetical protein